MQEIVEQNKFNLITSEWFQALIDDCKTNIIERRYRIASELLELKWYIGDRILQDVGNFERSAIYGKQIVMLVSKSLNCSDRELYRCIQFRKKYPDLDNLPEGKKISWHKIVNQYLPGKPKDGDDPVSDCPHRQVEILIRCARCRERLAFRRQGRDSSVDLGKLIKGENDELRTSKERKGISTRS